MTTALHRAPVEGVSQPRAGGYASPASHHVWIVVGGNHGVSRRPRLAEHDERIVCEPSPAGWTSLDRGCQAPATRHRVGKEPTGQSRRLGGVIRPMRGILVVPVIAAVLTSCVGAKVSPQPSSGTTSAPLPSATLMPSPSLGPSPSDTVAPTVAASGATGSGIASPAATIVAASATTPGSTQRPTPRPTPSPTVAPLQFVALRYRLVDQLGRPLFCDPDFYPVARADESALAAERFAGIRADTPTYLAITAHLGIDPSVAPSAAQILAIYREWKMLRSLVLQPANGAYGFDYIAASAPGAQQGWHVAGTIDAAGTVSLTRRDPSGQPPCPICLSRGTLIATPTGSIAVEALRAGMAVWTTDVSGARLAGTVLLVGSTPVPPTHLVVHLVLSDGRMLDASPSHPLPDGRRLGDLRPGDPADGAWVTSAELVPYAGAATYDLLPSRAKGTYWANGILLASTLGPTP